MKVTVTLDDALLKPLIDEHLNTGRAVGSLIADAISLKNKCDIELRKAGAEFAIYVAKKNNGRLYSDVLVDWKEPRDE